MNSFPAVYPISDAVDASYLDYGMSLRDYFAAKAMASLIIPDDRGMSEKMESGICKRLSEQAYRMADAMLEARKTNKEVL